MPRYNFTPAQISDMAQRYANGESPTAISESYGCSGPTIAHQLKTHGHWDVDRYKGRGRSIKYRFTGDQIAEMARRHRNGETSDAMSKDYGCGSQTITRVLKQHGHWDESLRYKTRLASQLQEIAERYRAGESMKSLGRAYGCSAPNIHFILKKQGVETRPRGRAAMPQETLDWIREQRELGVTYRSIADTLGITQNRVMWICRNMGLPLDPHKSGSEHHAWKGGRRVDDSGYVQVLIPPDDPMYCMATGLGYVPEHRLVMARKIGRPLTRYETVHHKNSKDKTNNDPSNLQLRWGNHGKGHAMRCLDCGSDNLGFEDLA
jgi:hypothetical protein